MMGKKRITMPMCDRCENIPQFGASLWECAVCGREVCFNCRTTTLYGNVFHLTLCRDCASSKLLEQIFAPFLKRYQKAYKTCKAILAKRKDEILEDGKKRFEEKRKKGLGW